MQKKLIVVALAASLAACGNPASVGAGTESGAIASSDSSESWTKKISRMFAAKASVTIPAQGAIADALLDRDFLKTLGDEDPSPGSMIRAIIPFTSSAGEFGKVLGELGEGASSPLIPVQAITAPYAGWQINLLGGFGDREATGKEKAFYLGYQEAAVEFTNALFTEIATKLEQDVGVMADPDEARSEIQRIYLTIPRAQLDQLWSQAIKHAADRGSRTIDMTGAQGVNWVADGSQYSGQQDGLSWTKNGVTWFGKGSLSGKSWTVGLESSLSRSREKSSGGTVSSGASVGDKASGGAQVR